MRPILTSLLSVIAAIHICIAQEYKLVTISAIDIPTDNPYGVTYHNGYFWITDAMNGDIIRLDKEGGDIKTIQAPRKNNTGLAFEGEYLWVLTDAWDSTNFWLLDPVEKKLKMMAIDTVPPDTIYPEPITVDTTREDSIPWPWLIDQIEVIPPRPSAGEDISIVVHTTFPSGGCSLLEKKIVKYGSAIQISALHDMGVLDYICSSIDTTALGNLPAGLHEITYTVSTIGTLPVSETVRIYVQDTVPLPYYLEIIPEKPVAGQEVKVIVHGICYVSSIIDIAGRHITLEAYFNGCSMTPCGIDTLSIGFLSEDSYTLDYYLYDICLSYSGSDSLVFYENMDLDIRNAISGTGLAPARSIMAYPNPASDYLFIDIPEPGPELTLSIFSVHGQLFYQDRFRSADSHYIVDLSAIPAGYYILRVSDNNNVYIRKISVLK